MAILIENSKAILLKIFVNLTKHFNPNYTCNKHETISLKIGLNYDLTNIFLNFRCTKGYKIPTISSYTLVSHKFKRLIYLCFLAQEKTRLENIP